LNSKQFEVLRELPKDKIQRCLTSASSPDWILGFSAYTNPPTYLILSQSSGTTLFESQPRDAFTDEVDLIPVAIAHDRKHLWLCGPTGHPILVNLETAKPVLRIHTWPDGGFVLETPDRRFHANAAGRRRIHRIHPTCDQVETRDDLVEAALDHHAITRLLASVMAP